MLPPLVYRVINPDADAEEAYILSCQLVLPAGMMGLVVAAMASATASAATSSLNVFAGAFTTEVYQRLINPNATDRKLVHVGRILTVLLGGIVIAGSLLIPRYGYTSFILDITTLLTGPLVLPTIWGLFSRKIGVKAVWGTTLAGFVAAVIVKFGLREDGFLSGIGLLQPVSEWVIANMRIADLSAGILVPLITLAILELVEKSEHPGWNRIQESTKSFHETEAIAPSTLPAKMVAITLTAIAVMMSVLAIIDSTERKILLLFSLILVAISSVVFLLIHYKNKVPSPQD